MTSSASRAPGGRKLLGFTEPRIFTPPLRPLSRRTSLGYECCDFMANVAGEPFDPWQDWVAKHALELMPDGSFRFRIIIILVARQNGKAIDCDVDILTANRGWTTVGELVAGDEVFHPDGQPVKVIAAHPVRPDRPCYQVTTTDGRSIVVDAEHLWTVQDVRRVTKKGRRGERPVVTRPWETLTTAQLLERGLMRDKRECAYRLPVQQPLTSAPANLPLDPYLLGAWLGDGDSTASKLTVGASDLEETAAAIEASGARIVSRTRTHTAWRLHFSIGTARKDGFESRCRKLGIWGDKHIPETYLTAGTEQRLALLQGLMDTDGSICVGGGGTARAEFCTVSRRLADGTLYLARSLGWRATLIEGRATIAGRDCGPKYRVCFTPQQGEMTPFRLGRKVAKIQASRSRAGERHAVSIRSIEPVETRPVRCITVEREDGLFLAGRDLIATHNSHLKRGVSLWRMYMQPASRVLGVAQEVTLAREQWQMCQDVIHSAPDLEDEWGDVRNSAGDEYFWLQNGSRYKIGAANRRSGRGGSNDEVNIDELREQRNWQAWAALSKTTMARDNSQIWLLSNAGDDESVVLNQLLEVARAGTDPTIFLAEYSGEEDCELDDWNAIRHANPNLGRRISVQAIRTALSTDPPEVFRTEVLCQHVPHLNQAIDAKAWEACADAAGVFDMRRGKTMAAFDIAPDGDHCTLAVAQLADDGRVRLAIAAAWDDTDVARKELPGVLDKIRPRALAWYPSGPAAAFASILRRRPGSVELTGGRVCEVCQEFADIVKARRIIQPGDPLLDGHVGGASKLKVTEGWRFTRQGGHVDAAYAAAGAAELALTAPISVSKIRVLSGR